MQEKVVQCCIASMLAAVTTFSAVHAATSIDTATDGQLVITVPDTETYTLQAADQNALGQRKLIKRGLGTLLIDRSLATASGEIAVEQGVPLVVDEAGTPINAWSCALSSDSKTLNLRSASGTILCIR